MAALCSHPGSRDRRVCAHIAADDNLDYLIAFTGAGLEYTLVCQACADVDSPVQVEVCASCFADRERAVLEAIGLRGRPEVRSRGSRLRFEHRTVPVAGLDSATLTGFAPLAGDGRGAWLAVVGASLVRLDLDSPGCSPVDWWTSDRSSG